MRRGVTILEVLLLGAILLLLAFLAIALLRLHPFLAGGIALALLVCYTGTMLWYDLVYQPAIVQRLRQRAVRANQNLIRALEHEISTLKALPVGDPRRARLETAEQEVADLSAMLRRYSGTDPSVLKIA